MFRDAAGGPDSAHLVAAAAGAGGGDIEAQFTALILVAEDCRRSILSHSEGSLAGFGGGHMI